MNKEFNPSPDNIKRICRFFGVGELQHYELEKAISFPHANYFIFAATTHGQYALKFYPSNEAKTISFEYAINRILAKDHFPTPAMYKGPGARAYMPSNGRLAACYSYINGSSAWDHIRQRKTIQQINAALLSLKNILLKNKKHIPIEKHPSLTLTINALLRSIGAMPPQDQQETIKASLLDACRTYQHHRSLFTRQWLHSDANLTNFLICPKNLYILDLSHIREDYALSDLASLIVSCVMSIPFPTIKAIAQDYFSQHKINSDLSQVLNTLIKIGLIKEYLSPRSAHKRSITALLKKMNGNPGLIV